MVAGSLSMCVSTESILSLIHIFIDLSMGKEPKDKLVLINPEIIFSEGRLYEEEGCLSFPDIREKIVRAAKVRIRAQDELSLIHI